VRTITPHTRKTIATNGPILNGSTDRHTYSLGHGYVAKATRITTKIGTEIQTNGSRVRIKLIDIT
jgi:hypothetical protein